MTAVVQLATREVIPLLQVQLPKLLSFGVRPIVYCCDEEATREAERLGAVVRRLGSSSGGVVGSERFANFCSAKFDAILDALRSSSVLFLDLDVEIVGNPLDALVDKPDCDIYAQDDWRPGVVPGRIVCTGCWWLRSCEEIRSMLLEARARQIDVSSVRYFGDEAAVNEVLAASVLRVAYCPLWENKDRRDSVLTIHHNGRRKTTVEEKLVSLGVVERPSVETFIHRGGPDRPCLGACVESLFDSDLLRTTVVDTQSLTMIRGQVAWLTRASQSRADLVLLLEDDVAVCRNIARRIEDWTRGLDLPSFGAANLCRIGSREPEIPDYGAQAILTRPEALRRLLPEVVTFSTDLLDLENPELWRRVHEQHADMLDIRFWRTIRASGLSVHWSPGGSWADHLGHSQTTWWGRPDDLVTHDFVG